MPFDPELISRAIVVWIGKVGGYPSRSDTRLVETFGAETATCLLPIVKELEREFFASDAADTVVGPDYFTRIREIGHVASRQFKAKHPEISDEAVKALANSYTFSNR